MSRNEIDQIGYRLAEELGHRAVYPVDEDGDFPWQPLVNYAKANGLFDKFQVMDESMAAQVKRKRTTSSRPTPCLRCCHT